MPGVIFKYFPDLSDNQKDKFSSLLRIYKTWNNMINVISRKDMENFYVHHVLHSLSIARIIDFKPGTKILDVGTGGGFPGIPLSIFFPDTEFTLLDSVGKKIKVVKAVIDELGISNVITTRKRVEEEQKKYHFIVSRAVTDFQTFAGLVLKNIDNDGNNTLRNGLIYLKGGNFDSEIKSFGMRVIIYNIKDYFSESYFETKKIIYLPH